MNKKIYQTLIFLFVLASTHESIASNKTALIKEQIENLDKNPEDIGLINGKKYIVSMQNDDVLIVAKVNINNAPEPIAQAKLGDLPYPYAEIKNNSVIVHSGYANQGTYNTDFIFKLKNNIFYLSKLRDTSNYNEDHTDPSVQIIQATSANFDESIIHYWEQRIVIYKNNNEYKPGFKAWEKSLYRMRNELPLLGGKSKIIKLKSKKIYPLDGINFDSVLTDVYRLTLRSSGTAQKRAAP
jgi:uncharacterized protein YlzI (FlbEa/FlbD family)